MKKKKIFLVAGARPNFVKIAPLAKQLAGCPAFRAHIVWTGQHYDYKMSEIFFSQLLIPAAGFCLDIGRHSGAGRINRISGWFSRICKSERPDLVMVVGDVDSTVICASSAWRLGIKLAHIEAGLRSFEQDLPEESNRVITDHISDFLFASCKDACVNLEKEGIPQDKIHFVGNVMIDTLLEFKKHFIRKNTISRYGLNKKAYAALTLHRSGNVDNPHRLEKILLAIRQVSKFIKIIFVTHPHTAARLKQTGLDKIIKNHITQLPPLGYLEFLNLVYNARFVLTDSGGLQEEAAALKIPCLTLRENTERPVTVAEGTNTLAGTDTDKIIDSSLAVLNQRQKDTALPQLWDGRSSERIVKILCAAFAGPTI